MHRNCATLLLLLSIFTLLFIFLLLPRKQNLFLDVVLEKPLQKRYVFFDLGANIGDSMKYFIDKDPRGQGLKGYAARDESIKWELHAIEANPFFNKHLDELKGHCEMQGHTLYLYKESAAWIRDEKITFYLDTVNPQHNYWGSSLNKAHVDVRNSNYKHVNVTGVNVSRLLSKYNSNDEVIMKIDIEGTEYELLKHLMQQKTLDLIDTIAIEFHPSLDNSPNRDLERFFKQYFQITNIKFVRWY